MHPEGLVSIIMPAYCVGDAITGNIEHVLKACNGLEIEVVVVDDGSPDQTFSAACAVDDDRVFVARHRTNRGKGEALKSGWRTSRGSLVVFLDGDLDLPPEQIPRLLPLLEEADVVTGAKRAAMGDGKYPTPRRILSKIFAAFTSGLFRLPVRETQTGLKLFHRAVLDDVLPDMRIRGYAFDLELLLRASRAGYRLVEAPVFLSEGAAEASLRPGMIWNLARDTARLALWSVTDPGLRPRSRPE